MHAHSPQQPKKPIIIIGAGVGGLTAGIALRRVGLEPLVFERSSNVSDHGSGLTLWPNALKALGYLGLAESISAISLRTEAIAMLSWKGRTLFRLGADNTAAESTDLQGVALLRSELLEVLRDQLGSDIIQFDKRCIAFQQNEYGITVSFEDGSQAEGDLLIGSDGIRSSIRAQLIGSNKLKYAGYTVWRGVATFQLEENIGSTSIGCGAQFGIFPMTRNRVYWFACTNARENGADLPIGCRQELLQKFQGWHKPIPAIIEATDEASIIRTDIYDHDPLRRWSYGRVTLLGDAAHPATPTLGQGACQAIEDAVVLALCIRKYELSTALSRYDSQRNPRTRTITLQSRQYGQMGRWTNPLACWFRDRLIASVPERIRIRELQKTFRFDPPDFIYKFASRNDSL